MIEITFRTAMLLAASVTFAILANLVHYIIIGEVNRKLPDGQQISYLFGYRGKYGRVIREYRRLCPNSRLDLLMKAFGLLSLVFLVAFGWDIGLLRAFFRL